MPRDNDESLMDVFEVMRHVPMHVLTPVRIWTWHQLGAADIRHYATKPQEEFDPVTLDLLEPGLDMGYVILRHEDLVLSNQLGEA